MDDAKYETVTEEPSALKKGKRILTYLWTWDEDVKQLRIKLSTKNSVKIKIIAIMVGGVKVEVNDAWIDQSTPLKKLLPLPNKNRRNTKIRVWVECEKDTNITCVIAKK